jgi:uncharacterized glyoxalase superfamily protein PhnB
MKTLGVAAVIHVKNLNQSLPYYIDVLGFTIDFQYGEYVGIKHGNVLLHLSSSLNPGKKKEPGAGHVCIDCDEVDAYYVSVREKGADISAPLDNRPYGMRDFAVDDPDGNTLVFGKSVYVL